MKKKTIISIVVAFLIVTFICVYNASRNCQDLVLNEKSISSEKISEEEDNLMVAFFSDLYFGNNCDLDRVNKICETINKFRPDLVFFTGDLFEEESISSEDEQALINAFSSVQPTYGKYAVFGDYDLRNENTKQLVTTILEQSGFTILTNTNKTIHVGSSCINLVGIDSLVSGTPDIETAFTGVDSSAFTFVLSHCPDTYSSLINYSFDYYLCGHSLGGRIYIPLLSYLWANTGYKHYYHGTVHDSDKTMDITNGAGTPGSTYRFNADPEIIFYTLRSAS